MKISRLLGQKASINGGDGVILSVTSDGRRVTGLVVADDNLRELYVRAEDAIFGREIVCKRAQKKPCRTGGLKLGRAAFDEDGKFLGYLKEIETHGLELASAKIGAKKYDFGCISAGDAVIVRTRSRAAIAARDMFIDALCQADGDKEQPTEHTAP